MRARACLLAVTLLATGCSAGGSGDGDPPPSEETTSAAAEPATEPATGPAPEGLALDCVGEGGPTVVLIAGLNTSGDTFGDLQERLSATARTCTHDRAGIGDSPALAADAPDPSPGSAAADLRETLATAGVDPPYVVLGWSYGGLVAQAYAKDFPDDMAGLVLEDTSVREQFTDGALVNPEIDWREGGRDIDQKALVKQVADPDYGDLPVAALSQDFRAPWIEAFYRSHDRLARASSEGVHAIGVGSGHAMHEDVPELVARTVEAVWAAAAAGGPLPDCRTLFPGTGARCRV